MGSEPYGASGIPHQKAYRAGKAAKEIKNQSVRTANVAAKVARKIQEIFRKNASLFLGAGLLMALLLFIMAGVSSCSAMFANTASTVIAASYLAEPEALEEAELYYTQMEAELQQEINRMEAEYPGMDEYYDPSGTIFGKCGDQRILQLHDLLRRMERRADGQWSHAPGRPYHCGGCVESVFTYGDQGCDERGGVYRGRYRELCPVWCPV